jgi:histone H3/H4
MPTRSKKQSTEINPDEVPAGHKKFPFGKKSGAKAAAESEAEKKRKREDETVAKMLQQFGDEEEFSDTFPAQPKRRKIASGSFPKHVTEKIFKAFVGKDTKISPLALDALHQGVDHFWVGVSKDLTAYASHAGRKLINDQDLELLMRRQGVVTDEMPISAVARKYLPDELATKIVPVMKADGQLTARPLPKRK